MSFLINLSINERLKASGIHFVFSVIISTVIALLVFGFWYPEPYREISGGKELFLLIVFVDVAMGPLITFAIFDLRKPRQDLVRDIGIVVILQIFALSYGLWTIAIARPVYLVFEIDRFRVVHVIDIPMEDLDKAPPNLRSLPYTGPRLLGLRKFKDVQEEASYTLAALGGASLSSRPELWQSYEETRKDVLTAAKPIDILKKRFPGRINLIDAAIGENDNAASEVGYVPLVARRDFGTVLVNLSTGDYLGYLSIDSF